MAFVTRTVTGDLRQMFGDTLDVTAVRGWAETNLDTGDQVIYDLDNGVQYFGAGTLTINSDGTWSLANIPDWNNVEADQNPTGVQIRVNFEYRDPVPSPNARALRRWNSGWLEIDADGAIGTFVEQQLAPADWRSDFMDQAEELLAQQQEISGLTGEDEAVAALVATPSSDTAAALTASIDDRTAAQAATPGSPLYTAIDETFVGLSAGTMPETVEHGWNPAAARPSTTGMVTWVGWVRPNNMASGDVWFMVESPTERLKSEIGWHSLWLPGDQGADDGDSLSTILDSSGNGHHLTLDVSIAPDADVPIFRAVTPTMNGKPSIEFNSTPMKTAALAGALTQPWSIFAIVRATAFPNTIVGSGSTPASHLYRPSTSPGSWRMNAAGTALSVDGSDTNTVNSRQHYMLALFNGVSSQFYKDGILKTTGNCGAGSLSSNGIRVGGIDALTLLVGNIAALGIYPGLFTVDHIATLDAFADSEYAAI